MSSEIHKEIWLADDGETWLVQPDDFLCDTDRARVAGCAPELLAACKGIEKVYKEAPSHVSFGRFMTDAIHKAIDAIAKAESR